jgi:hypothetical protein
MLAEVVLLFQLSRAPSVFSISSFGYDLITIPSSLPLGVRAKYKKHSASAR